MFVVCIIRNVHAVMEAENSITLNIYTSEHIHTGMVLRNDYGLS